MRDVGDETVTRVRVLASVTLWEPHLRALSFPLRARLLLLERHLSYSKGPYLLKYLRNISFFSLEMHFDGQILGSRDCLIFAQVVHEVRGL